MQLAVINRNNHSLHTCLYKYDAFGNAIGNSVVRAAQSGGSATGGGDKTGKTSSTTRGGSTADPFASIGQSISDDVGHSTNQRINEIAELGAINTSELALNSVPSQPLAELPIPFSLTESGIAFALNGGATLRGQTLDLVAKQASVASSQANLGVLSQRLSRITDGYQTPKDLEMARNAQIIANKQGQPRRYAAGLTPEHYAAIQSLSDGSYVKGIGTPLVPVGSYSGLIPQNGNPAFEFGGLLGASLPFAHGGFEASLGFDPNGDMLFNLSAFGGLNAQFDWTEWSGTTGFSALRTFDGTANDLITGLSKQHTLTFDALDFGATSLDFSLVLGETIPDNGRPPVHFEGFEAGLNFGKKGFLNGLQGITDQLSPLMRNATYSGSLEIAFKEPIGSPINLGSGAYEFARSTFSTFDDIYKGAAVASKLIFQSPGSFAAPVGVNPYYIQTHTQYQSQIEQLLKGGK